MHCSKQGYVQTDATTPNIVAPTMLVVVACVLAVVCKRMQQLPTMLGPAKHPGTIQPISLCKPCVLGVRGPNNVPRFQRFIALLYIFSKAATLLQFSRHEKFFGLFVCLFPHDRCYLL